MGVACMGADRCLEDIIGSWASSVKDAFRPTEAHADFTLETDYCFT